MLNRRTWYLALLVAGIGLLGHRVSQNGRHLASSHPVRAEAPVSPFYQYNGVSIWPVVKIAGGLSAYDAWVALKFTTAQIQAGIADPADDSDLDGITNLAEMALGSSTTAFNISNPFAPLAGSTDAAGYLKSTFARSAANPGVWLSAQFSSDLSIWQPADPLPGTNPTYDILEDSATRFTVRDKTPADGATPKRFVRFVVRKPD